MKLIKVRVTNYRSVEDSEEFDIDDLTCLVGKNEAGKTAILTALNGIKPFDDFSYDKTRDFPRRNLNKFDELYPSGDSVVVCSTWKLEEDDIEELERQFGEGVLLSHEFNIESKINNKRIFDIKIDKNKLLQNLYEYHELSDNEKSELINIKNTVDLYKKLANISNKSKEQTELFDKINGYRDNSEMRKAIDIIMENLPKFFYTSHFDRMAGKVSIVNLITKKNQNQKFLPAEKIFIDFLSYAGTSLEELNSSTRTEDLIAKCEGASNEITEEIFNFLEPKSIIKRKNYHYRRKVRR